MKRLVFVLLLALMACGGSLSDEQRKNMREQMELHKIRKVTQAEITSEAYTRGRKLMALVEKTKAGAIDSLAKATHTEIRWIKAGEKNGKEMEQQVIEAYLEGAATGTLEDNVQPIRNAEGDADALLYTKPVVTEMADGSVVVNGTWNITFSRKYLILGMEKK